MQNAFGSGVLWGTPLTDATGAAIAVPTPIQFGVLQDTSIDMSFDTKMLYGQKQFPVAVGRGKGKMSGKAKFAQFNGATLNSLFFGQTLSAGIIGDVQDFSGSIPATPFTITVTPPSSGTWTQDLGVKDSNGLPMTRVATGPSAGQYSVSAGAYVFAAADTGKTVLISYQYTATSTSAQKSTINSLLMGYTPSFRADLYLPYNGKQLVLTLNNCVSSKLQLATKQDDFMVPEMDFEAFADPTGVVGYWSTTE